MTQVALDLPQSKNGNARHGRRDLTPTMLRAARGLMRRHCNGPLF